MAHWRFSLLVLTLFLAAGCPNRSPQRPAPAPVPAAPARATPAPNPAAPEPRRGRRPPDTSQQAPHAFDDLEGESLPQEDPTRDASGTPLLGRFEGFSERGAEGTRVYRGGKLRTRVLEGRSEEYGYDSEGRLASVDGDDGLTRSYLHRPNSVIELELGPDQESGESVLSGHAFVLDPETGLPQAFLRTKGPRWDFTWAGKRVKSEEGPRGARSYRYDAAGRLKAWSDDSGRSVSVTRKGAELRVVSAAGEEVRVVRDAEGGVRQAGSGKTLDHEFSYDDQGRLSAAKSPAGTIRYQSDEARRVQTSPWGEVRTARESVPGRGEQVLWIETPAGEFGFDYEEGKRSELTYPNGVVVRYEYGAGRSLERLTSSVLKLEQGWDEQFRLETQRRDGASAATRFGYDGSGHLDLVEGRGRRVSYVYDTGGNRAATSSSPGERTMDRITQQSRLKDRVLLRQNKQGKWRQEETLQTYRCDAAGRLLEIKAASGAQDRFRYDGFGRLVEAQRAGKARVRYGYDPLGRLATRRTGEGANESLTRYVYDGLRLLAELGSTGSTRVYLHGPDIDEPLAYRDDAGPWVFLHGDERGSVLAYSNMAGELVDSVHFSPFGVLEIAPTKSRPLFFAGHPYDPETRLVLARARAYDPDLNRFLGPDPAGLRDGANPFLYARGNPLSYVDPLGLWAVPGSVRGHYGTLSPRAQLILLQQVQALRLSPTPRTPILNLFGKVYPNLSGDSSEEAGDRRTGRRAGAELSELLALAESSEEAREVLASPLGEAAEAELTGRQWQTFEKIAAIADDEERAQDSELLRELYAPTKEEEGLKVRRVRATKIYAELAEKHLGDKGLGVLAGFLEVADGMLSAIDRREKLNELATSIPGMDAVMLREHLEAVDRLTRPRGVAGHVEVEAEEVPEPPSIGDFAASREHSYRMFSASPTRRELRSALQAQRKLWLQHERDLTSPASVARAVAEDADLNDLTDLMREAYRDQQAAEERVAQAERGFRAALIKPLSYAEAWRRIKGDWSLFQGKNTVALLKESLPVGRSQALHGKLPVHPDFTYSQAKKPNYHRRLRELETEIRAAAEARERETEAAAALASKRARREAKRRARRGAPRGISLASERLAARPSGVSLARRTPGKRPRAASRGQGRRRSVQPSPRRARRGRGRSGARRSGIVSQLGPR